MAAASATVRFDPLRFTKRVVSADEQRRLTAEAAYFRAEKRQFDPGFEIEDWFHAERELAEYVVISTAL